MTRPTVVDFWAALRAGDKAAIDALEHARRTCHDAEVCDAERIRLAARLDGLTDTVAAARRALKRGNMKGAQHLLDHALDNQEEPK